MRKEFMKAAKSVGTFLTAGLLALGLSFNAHAQNDLPLPAFPANFEVAEYQGQKGCVPDDSDYITAVSINSGAFLKGTQLVMQSPKDGKYNEVFYYNYLLDEGYLLSDKQDGKLCVIDKVTNLSFGTAGTFNQVVFDGEITKRHCDQTPYRFEGVCGSFNSLSAKLTANGFDLQWQALDSDGNIKTLLSGNNKTYVLTTNTNNNATVLTKVSTHGEYINYEDKNAPGFVAALK